MSWVADLIEENRRLSATASLLWKVALPGLKRQRTPQNGSVTPLRVSCGWRLCRNLLPSDRRKSQLFCSTACRVKAWREARR